MKVGIYCEFYDGNTIGGREYIAAVLCEWLTKRGNEVELIHHSLSLQSEDLAQRFGMRAEDFRLRYLPTRPRAKLFSPWRKLARIEWEKSFSAPYDLFIAVVHDVPLRCYAPHGVLMVLFPFVKPFGWWGDWRTFGFGRLFVWMTLHQWRYRFGWQARLASFGTKTSISKYSRHWTRRRWRVNSQVVYPPAEVSREEIQCGEKENLILAVGRFAITGVLKRQRELMLIFRQMVKADSLGWRFVCAGGIGGSPLEREYLEKVRRLGEGVGGEVYPGLPHAELQSLYQRAKIFWHAAGLGTDPRIHPELSEHYGIATVEAMFAGCVPVVINRGAQPEIVEHGVSGFLWNTREELQSYTGQIMADESLRERMSSAAKERAKTFSKARFESCIAEILPETGAEAVGRIVEGAGS